MEIRKLFANDDAVSPVIGVILMVAITVILAAVIGTFVLGLGDQVQSTAPSASLTFDFNDNGDNAWGTGDTIKITHDGGDSVNVDRLGVVVGGTPATIDDWTGDVGAGSVETIDYSGTAWATDDEVVVTWTSEDGSKSSTLGTATVPSA